MPRKKSVFVVVLESFGWPVLWGLAGTFVFYALIEQEILKHPIAVRYFAGHPVEYIETALFFVGLAVVLLKGFDVVRQFVGLGTVRLPENSPHSQDPAEASSLLESLGELPVAARGSYLAQRLTRALEHVHRKKSADDLDDELKYLSDMDASRMHDDYALVRIIVWAIPMLGFLGTVIGITLALGDLSPEALVNAPKEAMEGLLAGLSIAFDTTALALSLSIMLMFSQFLVIRVEAQLQSAIDQRATRELVGRFHQLGTGNDPHLASVERMALRVAQSCDQLVRQQTELWRNTIDQSNQHWQSLVNSTSNDLEQAWSGAMRKSLEEHALHLRNADQQTAQQWERVLDAANNNIGLLQQQQRALSQQGESLTAVTRAVGEITKLESSLVAHLGKPTTARELTQTLGQLSSVVHLLNKRLQESTRRPVSQQRDQKQAA